MYKNIGYHTRSKDGVKLTGGSFGGAIDQDTVERITRLFSVRVLPSGSVTFVDDKGRDINLYFSIDAVKTEKGKQALKEYQEQKELEWKQEKAKLEAEQEELEWLMAGMSHEEIINRLRDNTK